MHSTLMVVVMETDTPMDILNNGMFWETLINTNLVAPAAVPGTLIQSNSSFDWFTFLVVGNQIVLV